MTKPNKKLAEKRNDNPVPVRMGDLKEKYRIEAFKLDRSMQWLILQGLKEYAKTFKQ